jgi:hypothetical protein
MKRSELSHMTKCIRMHQKCASDTTISYHSLRFSCAMSAHTRCTKQQHQSWGKGESFHFTRLFPAFFPCCSYVVPIFSRFFPAFFPDCSRLCRVQYQVEQGTEVEHEATGACKVRLSALDLYSPNWNAHPSQRGSHLHIPRICEERLASSDDHIDGHRWGEVQSQARFDETMRSLTPETATQLEG